MQLFLPQYFAGVDVKIADKNGKTALHYAAGAFRENVEMVKSLLEAGKYYFFITVI
jgi:ankyrin repeat protein